MEIRVDVSGGVEDIHELDHIGMILKKMMWPLNGTLGYPAAIPAGGDQASPDEASFRQVRRLGFERRGDVFIGEPPTGRD